MNQAETSTAINACELCQFRAMLSFRSLKTGFGTFAAFKPCRSNLTTPTRRFLFSKRTTDVPALYKPRQDPWINPTMLVIGFIPFFTFALGTWQLYRLQWKVALIDELEEKLQLQPLSLPQKIKYASAVRCRTSSC